MTPIDIQVSKSKVSVEGQAFSLYVGEGGGISVLQTAIFVVRFEKFLLPERSRLSMVYYWLPLSTWLCFPRFRFQYSGNHAEVARAREVRGTFPSDESLADQFVSDINMSFQPHILQQTIIIILLYASGIYLTGLVLYVAFAFVILFE